MLCDVKQRRRRRRRRRRVQEQSMIKHVRI
jgi:hypothetical protein